MLTLAIRTLPSPIVAENKNEAEQRAGGKDDERENPGATRAEVLFTRQHRDGKPHAYAER